MSRAGRPMLRSLGERYGFLGYASLARLWLFQSRTISIL